SVSRELLSTLDPASAANALVRQAQELAEADGAVLLTLHRSGERLEAAASATTARTVRAVSTIPLEQSASGEAIISSRIVTALDVGEGYRSALRGAAPFPEE